MRFCLKVPRLELLSPKPHGGQAVPLTVGNHSEPSCQAFIFSQAPMDL